ncbi:MAG: ubiquinol-cytochrome C chaperone [Brevundimonas sp.]|nr:MAG: ubiquinol-cytochrome C chaperone [Brevundimonas sp.]
MLKSLFKTRPPLIRRAEAVGDPLYAAVAAQARQPAFYTVLGVADRIDARFELYTLHALLLILRLRDEDAEGGGAGAQAAQSLFDVYVSALDNVLRELGVGDISMARKMRNLGEALYGRMTAYEGPLRAGDQGALATHLARNVFESAEPERGEALAAYALAARSALANQSFAEVLNQPHWPEISA